MELPDFEILGPVGSGGMGLVYKARDLNLDRLTAVKILDRHWQNNEELARRFQREARIAAQMDHPHICTVYNYGTCEMGPFLAMAWCDGGSLKELLTAGQPDLAQTLSIVRQVALGLDYAAARRIIHRDIKPGNIMFHQGQAKIVDFGIARDLSATDATHTAGSPGTPAYMSPEQIDRLSLDHRTDQWSLGVVLYQMLTGRQPFGQKDQSFEAFCYEICFKKPTPAIELAPISPALNALVLRMLSQDRHQRFPSFAELAKNLEELERSEANHSDRGSTAPQPAPKTQPRGEIRVGLLFDHQHKADAQLARDLVHSLAGSCTMLEQTPGGSWPGQAISGKTSGEADFLICLLSEPALRNELFRADAAAAHQLSRNGGRPRLLPVKVRHRGPLHYPLGHYFDSDHQAVWMEAGDTPGLTRALQDLFGGRSTKLQYQSEFLPDSPSNTPRPPLPQAPLETPSGTMDPDSRFYIRRQADEDVETQLNNPKTSFTIHGPRQTGKSSLLMRAGQAARNQGKRVAFVDLQLLEKRILEDPDRFYRRFCVQVSRALGLADATADYWEDGSNNISCTSYFEDYILERIQEPLLLAVDEADRLMETPWFEDFFGMLRSWLNNRFRGTRWERFGLALVTSTEAASLIDGINQSPFNVGTWIYLEDFTSAQLEALNLLHGNPLGPQDLPRIYHFLGGHPYLIRRALYDLARERHSLESLLNAVLEGNNPFLDHLQHYHRILRERTDLKDSFLQILKTGASMDEASAARLEQIGLVRRIRDRYQTRCALYQQYFSDRFS